MTVKMIIVDDESIILESLETMIDWRAAGVEVVGTASNGAAAVEMTLKLRPDIILSDISMPLFSGLEMLETLRRHKADSEVIFITAYGRFEFARDAIRHGAFDYILKPIDEKLLLKTVERCAEKIRAQRVSRRDTILVSCILQGRTPSDAEQSELNHAGFELRPYATLAGRWYDGEERQTAKTPPDCEVIRLNVTDSHDLILLLSSDAPKRELFAPQNGVLCAVSEYCETYRCFERGYAQVCLSMLSGHTGEVVYFSGFKNKTALQFDDYKTAQEVIGGTVRNGEKDILPGLLFDFFLLMLDDNGIYDLNFVKLRCISLVDYIINDMASVVMPEYLENPEKTLSAGKSINSCAGLDGVFSVTRKLLVNFAICASETRTPVGRRLVRQAVGFIHENYTKDITLATAARSLYVSPAYLSRAFSGGMGVSFSHYLLGYRVEQAKRLLLNTNDKVYEIAERVGFANITHFSKAFKSVAGVSPNQYRNRG